MNLTRKMWFSIAIGIIAASASFAEQIKTDYDRHADLSRYKTYSWEKVQTQNPLWSDRIKAAVNSALSAKGWSEVEATGDVSIIAMEMTKEHRTLNTYYDTFYGGWGWRWGGEFGNDGVATTTEESYEVGTLVIDLFDRKTRKLIWRGSAADTLSNKSDRNIRTLDQSVLKMFSHFPPSTQKRRTTTSTPIRGLR